MLELPNPNPRPVPGGPGCGRINPTADVPCDGSDGCGHVETWGSGGGSPIPLRLAQAALVGCVIWIVATSETCRASFRPLLVPLLVLLPVFGGIAAAALHLARREPTPATRTASRTIPGGPAREGAAVLAAAVVRCDRAALAQGLPMRTPAYHAARQAAINATRIADLVPASEVERVTQQLADALTARITNTLNLMEITR